MIERDEHRIFIPTDDQILAIERWERLNARMKHFEKSLSSARDSTTWLYYPATEGIPTLHYTSGWARSTFERAERAIQKDITASGLNDIEWQQDWTNLIEGRTNPAPQSEDQGVCGDGHSMLKRSRQYWLCPLDGQIKWTKPL